MTKTEYAYPPVCLKLENLRLKASKTLEQGNALCLM